jgi:hypothetical protein
VPFEVDREPNDLPFSAESRDELRYRLRQQSLLGEFGRFAMQTRDFRKILQRATELCASGLQARFAKVLYEPDEMRLMVPAGSAGRRTPSISFLSPPTSARRPVTRTGPVNPSYPTTSRRKPASGRLSSWRTTASGAR